MQIAHDERLDSLRADMLQENIEMQSLVRKLGFRVTSTEDPAVLFGSFNLREGMPRTK
jgi:hypothetical protein